ncbi:MAG: hypothetical protein LIO58_00460 [Oscillospiraceae bacterium]|nr:hypothetical protein [Oscillospiraceae bacterium]
MKRYFIHYGVLTVCLLLLSRLTWGRSFTAVLQLVYLIGCLAALTVIRYYIRRDVLIRIKEINEAVYLDVIRPSSGSGGFARALTKAGDSDAAVKRVLHWWRGYSWLHAALTLLPLALLGLSVWVGR